VAAQARESLMRLWSYNAPQPIAPTNGFCRGGDTTFTMIAGAGGGGGGPGLPDPTTTLGDLIVRGSANVTRLPAGNQGDVLTVDQSAWSGLAWRRPPAAGTGDGIPNPWTEDVDADRYNLLHVGQVSTQWLTFCNDTDPALDVSMIAGRMDVTGPVNATGYFVNGQPFTGGSGGTQSPWIADVDADRFNLLRLGQVSTQYLTFCNATDPPLDVSMIAGRLNLAAPLEVNGDVNVINGTYRVNGLPTSGVIPTGPPPGPASPQDGQLWFDTATHHLVIYVSGAWFQLT